VEVNIKMHNVSKIMHGGAPYHECFWRALQHSIVGSYSRLSRKLQKTDR